MLNKRFRLLSGAVLMLVLLFAIFGCEGKKGSLRPLDAPTVTITSYEGVESIDEIPEVPNTFRRRIYWSGNSNGGVIDGYAYRVLNMDGEPIQTSGTFIDEEGWVYHYKPGADTDIPLTNPDVRSRWTKNVTDVIYFPSSTEEGEADTLVSIFEIKCKDHRGNESEIVRRYFSVTSQVPGVDVIFADRFRVLDAYKQDPPRIRTIGTGVEVRFDIQENTPYVPDNFASYFMFRFTKRDVASGELLPEYQTEWYSTQGQRNIYRAWLTLKDGEIYDMVGRDDIFKVLELDEFAGPRFFNPITETVMEVKAINLAGVHSDIEELAFRVFDDFETEALIYVRRINVLGQNHFATFQDQSVTRPLPFEETPEGVRFGTPFFIDSQGRYAALNSADIKIYLNWGWTGQYENQDPDHSFLNETHDRIPIWDEEEEEWRMVDYLGNIVAYDLRINSAPYYYPPLSDSPDFYSKYLFVDDEGLEWLRIPRTTLYHGSLLLTEVMDGENLFEVRILDSQNKLSETKEFLFKVRNRVPRDQKSGILILDNDNHPTLDPQINEFYQAILSQYSGEVHYLNRRLLRDTVWDSRLHYNRNVFSPTDLEQFGLVIYHCDVPMNTGDEDANFHREFGAINQYLRGGGNIILSSGRNLEHMLDRAYEQGWNTIFDDFMGIGLVHPDQNNVYTLSGAFNQRPYFVKAVPAGNNYPEMNLNLSLNISPANTLEKFGGLGPVAYFNENILLPGATPIYSFGSRPVGDTPSEPSEEEFEHLTGQPVAIKNTLPNNTTFTFGFPLSFMEVEEARVFINQVIQELGI